MKNSYWGVILRKKDESFFFFFSLDETGNSHLYGSLYIFLLDRNSASNESKKKNKQKTFWTTASDRICIIILKKRFWTTASDRICIIIIKICIRIKIKEGGFFNARYKNISFCGTCDKHSMVWVFSGSIDRNESFIPRCFVISLFLILVILIWGEMKKSNFMWLNFASFFQIFRVDRKDKERKNGLKLIENKVNSIQEWFFEKRNSIQMNIQFRSSFKKS